MADKPYKIEQGIMGRWIIVNARDPELAWSGSCWREHDQGIGRRGHISNFDSQAEAEEHAREVFGV